MKPARPTRLLLPFLGAVAAALTTGLVIAVAQTTGNFGTPPRLIPYSGDLNQNGEPLNGTVKMRFLISTTPTGAAAWSETHDAVPVQNGRFAVALGAKTALSEALLRNPALYLGIAVQDIELSGRQRLLSTPSAIVAASAADLSVTGTLTTKDLNVTGALSVGGNATVNGNLTLNGNADFKGVVPGRVLGGAMALCSGNSSVRHGCSPWGVGNCGTGCNAVCSKGTVRNIAHGSCYVPQIAGEGYCYNYLCVE